MWDRGRAPWFVSTFVHVHRAHTLSMYNTQHNPFIEMFDSHLKFDLNDCVSECVTHTLDKIVRSQMVERNRSLMNPITFINVSKVRVIE